MPRTRYIAAERFACGTGVGEYHAGTEIVDYDTWPAGMLQTRVERGSVLVDIVDDTPAPDASDAPQEPKLEPAPETEQEQEQEQTQEQEQEQTQASGDGPAPRPGTTARRQPAR